VTFHPFPVSKIFRLYSNTLLNVSNSYNFEFKSEIMK
jgi:hypothetical protein